MADPLKKRLQALTDPRRRRGQAFLCGQRPRFLPPPPKRGASQPPILFSREKRTGRWSGPRENAPGASILTVLHEARKGPWTPPDWVRARRFTQPTPSKKKGLTGEHGSPVKSRAARGAVPHCASAEAPRLWGAESASPGGRKKCALRAQNRVRPRPWRGINSALRRFFSGAACGGSLSSRAAGPGGRGGRGAGPPVRPAGRRAGLPRGPGPRQRPGETAPGRHW